MSTTKRNRIKHRTLYLSDRDWESLVDLAERLELGVGRWGKPPTPHQRVSAHLRATALWWREKGRAEHLARTEAALKPAAPASPSAFPSPESSPPSA